MNDDVLGVTNVRFIFHLFQIREMASVKTMAKFELQTQKRTIFQDGSFLCLIGKMCSGWRRLTLEHMYIAFITILVVSSTTQQCHEMHQKKICHLRFFFLSSKSLLTKKTCAIVFARYQFRKMNLNMNKMSICGKRKDSYFL